MDAINIVLKMIAYIPEICDIATLVIVIADIAPVA